MSRLKQIKFKSIIEKNWRLALFSLLLLNFALRLFIYGKTVLFSFSDYKVYLEGVDKIYNGDSIKIMNGNFLFAISYIGYFAKYVLGSLNFFFIFNCLLGTLTTYFGSVLIIRVSGNPLSGVISAMILTFYTEFMVFSSVFYTPVIMLCLLSLFIWVLYLYYESSSFADLTIKTVLIVFVFLATFLFKPELIFLPIFLILFSLFFARSNREFFFKTITLSFLLLTTCYLLLTSGTISHPKGNTISNAFVFFGHTDYGGDGGEGSFVYHENEVRYNKALSEWCDKNNITQPGTNKINRFQKDEVIKYITHSPFSWIRLQFTKFFRTFGVVPETTSFKILYTGLFKGNLWLTSIAVVAPVALIILLFILFFNFTALKNLLTLNEIPTLDRKTARPQDRKTNYFLYIYFLLFLYYLIATVFFGQYQERYRMPMMVVFIIPTLGYFIASFNRIQFLERSSLIIKGAVIVLFLAIWTFQAEKAISNKTRLNNALGSVIPGKPDA